MELLQVFLLELKFKLESVHIYQQFVELSKYD
jgi:hypothetical protein